MSYAMSTVSIRIPEALREELEALAERQGRPMSDLVRESLRRYVAAERFQTLRRRTLPFAEARGVLTDEDVFEAIS